MQIPVKLEVFEGPLDLLLHLIDKNQINIYDIPIVTITEQYLDYVNRMPKRDLDVVSEFMVMAATLIQIKAKMLLPPEENEEGEELDPREELVARLIEYKTFKALASSLRDKEEGAEGHFYKETTLPKEVIEYIPPIDMDALLGDLTLQRLQEVFQMVMRRQMDKVDPVRSHFGTIQREKLKLSDKISFIRSLAAHRQSFRFRELLETAGDKTELVVTFLAILELMKVGQLTARQEEAFGELEMEWNQSGGGQILQTDLDSYQ